MERRWNEWIGAEEVVKDWRKARSCAAKAGNSFSDFRPSSDILPLLYSLTFISGTSLTSSTPKVLSLPTDLERVSP